MSEPGIRPLPLVAFDGVTLAYRERDVLRDVSFELAAGELVTLVGPNGAGKSSLLRVLAGIATPRLGRAWLGGDPVDRLDRLAIARRLAVVPQLMTLPFATRVEEVVALGRLAHEHPLRGPRPADRAAVAAAIERVGVGHLLGRDVRELSLGERQLVLLAMAVAQGAPLLVLDEPTVHLDLRHQVEVMHLLADLNARDGVTILAVLHDLSLAAHFFPRALVLERGALVADGPARDVLGPGTIRDVFGVDPAVVGLAGDGASVGFTRREAGVDAR